MKYTLAIILIFLLASFVIAQNITVVGNGVQHIYVDKDTGKVFKSPPLTKEEQTKKNVLEIKSTGIDYLDTVIMPFVIGSGFIYSIGILFFSSAVVSTIFVPFAFTEVIASVLITAGMSKLLILLTVGVGAVIGSLINYTLGSKGAKLVYQHISPTQMQKATKFMDKYGSWGLFFLLAVPLPMPLAEPMTVIAGILKTDVKQFIITTFFGHIVRNALFYGIVTIIGNATGVIPFTIVLHL
jgi:membrane protein YqaA with SNARE-associated domain